jgi:hypothetical protein
MAVVSDDSYAQVPIRPPLPSGEIALEGRHACPIEAATVTVVVHLIVDPLSFRRPTGELVEERI